MVRAQVIAAAARPVLPLLNGPMRDGAVLGAFTRAVIISVPTPDGPRVLSLLGPTAAGGLPAGSGSSFVEIARRHGDYALCGVGAIADLE